MMDDAVRVETGWSRRAALQAALGLACLPGARRAEATSPMPHPPSVVGDRWVYQLTDAVDASKEETYEKVHWGIDEPTGFDILRTRILTAKVESKVGRGSRRLRDRSTFFEWAANAASRPKFVDARFPLSPGDRWEFENEEPSGPNGSFQQIARAAVGKLESLTVPAGTFETLPIEINAFWNWRGPGLTSSGTIERTMWYAPAARGFVRRDFTRRVSGSPFPIQAKERLELIALDLKPA